MASIEENVEDYYKKQFKALGIRCYSKTEPINKAIDESLKKANSKSGNNGGNFPDIRFLIDENKIPVMVEAKGSKGKLEKLTKDGQIELITYYESDQKNKAGEITHKKGDPKFNTVRDFAVNGALHYGNAILDEGGYNEVIIMGINGSTLDAAGNPIDTESKAYYVSKKNNCVPKEIKELNNDLSILKKGNEKKLSEVLTKLKLTDKEIEDLTRRTETTLESKIKSIHQSLYDDPKFKNSLATNDKLYLFCGLIMAGLKTKGVSPVDLSDLKGNDNDKNNDSTKIMDNIYSFLDAKGCSEEKLNMIISLLTPVFSNKVLWAPINGESVIKALYREVKNDIIPCLESNLHLDFTGRILNSLNDWVSIDNDKDNDVVLTPRYITSLMARLTKTNKDSFVWDKAMGSAGFLVSAMDIMIKDAKAKIKDEDELEKKIKHIKENQLLGIEILGNIYILAVLNMILMGDGSSHIIRGDSHEYILNEKDFPANVFLLNPPYSAKGNGFIFVEEALKQMSSGYAAILIQESTGSGKGLPYTANVLKNNTLIASIKMPGGLFGNKASVSVCIFVFKVARKHEEDDIVQFIDFTNDGYTRQNRKKSSQEVNLKDTDNASGRYDEIVAHVLGKKPKTEYYTKENGCIIEDTISLNGDDWLFSQHQKIDTTPTEGDFKKTVADYLAWKISNLMKGIG